MADPSPILIWFRRDLRLADNPALDAACASAAPVIPVFLFDEVMERFGACPTWRMGLAVGSFAERLAGSGSRLILRRGQALAGLRGLIRDTGARSVYWNRLYDPDSIARDTEVKAGLKDDGIGAVSFAAHTLFEPWEVETGSGGPYKVFTPFWNAVKRRDVGAALSAPAALPAPGSWPASDDLADWETGAAMGRGAAIVSRFVNVGEDSAQARLAGFVRDKIADYHRLRDLPGEQGTSLLSENLTHGEISVRACWHVGHRAMEEGRRGAETFLKELAWRDFAHHLAYHTPRLTTGNWREDWDAFPWNEDERRPEVRAWKRGRTGIRFVDAAMREMFVTGRMHNRSRMIVASYLTKHLMCHWRIGQKWFEHCLKDWDPANNALGWQWSAGSGPDATPFFRVFNPVTQLDKFDPARDYVDRWIAEGQERPGQDALAFFEAIPRRWSMSASDPYPDPILSVGAGRKRALAAYEDRDF